jgi:hypothetical protein
LADGSALRTSSTGRLLANSIFVILGRIVYKLGLLYRLVVSLFLPCSLSHLRPNHQPPTTNQIPVTRSIMSVTPITSEAEWAAAMSKPHVCVDLNHTRVGWWGLEGFSSTVVQRASANNYDALQRQYHRLLLTSMPNGVAHARSSPPRLLRLLPKCPMCRSTRSMSMLWRILLLSNRSAPCLHSSSLLPERRKAALRSLVQASKRSQARPRLLLRCKHAIARCVAADEVVVQALIE